MSGSGYGMPHARTIARKDQRRTPWIHIGSREEAILDRAFGLVQSVPYSVSLRWLFYRLYQEGFYKTKKEYGSRFIPLLSRARHTGFKDWRPDTLADDTRKVEIRTGGYSGENDAMRSLGSRLRDAAYVSIDHFFRQERYIELWFEARAMAGQFGHYTRGIDLVPMGGEASIPWKWSLAMRLDAAADLYRMPIKILYFGDEDLAGHKIQKTVEFDVRRWTDTDFDLVWCGLTKEQIRKYDLPESIEKKGYQWEAVSDKAAEEIIMTAMEEHIDVDLINEVEAEETEIFNKCGEIIDQVLDKLGGEK